MHHEARQEAAPIVPFDGTRSVVYSFALEIPNTIIVHGGQREKTP